MLKYSELDDPELDDSELDNTQLDEFELDDSELQGSKLNTSELNGFEFDASKLIWLPDLLINICTPKWVHGISARLTSRSFVMGVRLKAKAVTHD